MIEVAIGSEAIEASNKSETADESLAGRAVDVSVVIEMSRADGGSMVIESAEAGRSMKIEVAVAIEVEVTIKAAHGSEAIEAAHGSETIEATHGSDAIEAANESEAINASDGSEAIEASDGSEAIETVDGSEVAAGSLVDRAVDRSVLIEIVGARSGPWRSS